MLQKDFELYDLVLSRIEHDLQCLRAKTESDGYHWLVEDLDPALKAVRHAIEEIARDDPYPE